MALSVITVASGGLPVVDVTATTKNGVGVSEAVPVNGVAFGVPVTKVTAPAPGLAVVYVVPPP
jgi:hypothetical protein